MVLGQEVPVGALEVVMVVLDPEVPVEVEEEMADLAQVVQAEVLEDHQTVMVHQLPVMEVLAGVEEEDPALEALEVCLFKNYIFCSLIIDYLFPVPINY